MSHSIGVYNSHLGPLDVKIVNPTPGVTAAQMRDVLSEVTTAKAEISGTMALWVDNKWVPNAFLFNPNQVGAIIIPSDRKASDGTELILVIGGKEYRVKSVNSYEKFLNLYWWWRV